MTIKKEKWKKALILAVVFICILIGMSISARAASEDTIIKILTEQNDLFVQNSTFKDVGRGIGWAIAKGLSAASGWAQTLYTYSLGLVDFTTYGPMQQWVTTLKPVFAGIVALSLLWLGITLIVDHKKKTKLLTSICLMALCVSGLSYLLATFSPLTKNLALEILGDTKISNAVIAENTFDLLYIDGKYGLGNIGDTDQDLSYRGKDIDYKLYSINEVINPDEEELTDDGKEILSKQLKVKTDDTGKTTASLKDISSGIGLIKDSQGNGMFNNYYYRYKVYYLPVILTGIAFLIVFICLAYKVVRLVFEITISRVLALLYSADITGTQKTLKILGSIKDGYIVLLFTALEIKFFYFMQDYLNQTFKDNRMVYALLLLFVAIAVIDGPNLIQQLTGIDAGLSSVIGKGIAANQAITGVVQTVARPFNMMHAAQVQKRATTQAANAFAGRMQAAMNQLNTPVTQGTNDPENSGTGGTGNVASGTNAPENAGTSAADPGTKRNPGDSSKTPDGTGKGNSSNAAQQPDMDESGSDNGTAEEMSDGMKSEDPFDSMNENQNELNETLSMDQSNDVEMDLDQVNEKLDPSGGQKDLTGVSGVSTEHPAEFHSDREAQLDQQLKDGMLDMHGSEGTSPSDLESGDAGAHKEMSVENGQEQLKIENDNMSQNAVDASGRSSEGGNKS